VAFDVLESGSYQEWVGIDPYFGGVLRVLVGDHESHKIVHETVHLAG